MAEPIATNDVAFFLVNACWFVLGYGVAFARHRLGFKRQLKAATEVVIDKTVKQLQLDASKPTCGCGHNIAFHTEHKGKCKKEE